MSGRRSTRIPSDRGPAPAGGRASGSPGAPDRSLAAAVICRGLALALRRPDSALQEGVLSEEGRLALRRAAEEVGRTAAPEVAGRIARAIATIPDPGPDALASAHRSLFGPTLRGRVCPYETEYGAPGVFRQTQELADIAGSYLAFGLEAPAAAGERVDAIVCELEFVGFLHMKEAWAIDHGDDAMAGITRAARRKFLRDHLGRFGRAFATRLAEADPGGFHGRVGEAIGAFLEAECGHHGVAAGPRLLDLRDPVEDPAPMACGAPGAAGDTPPLRIGSRRP